MASYGYGTTTSGPYDAAYGEIRNSGANGGGFMGGSQGGSGSQDTPGGSKTYGKDTLHPVTVKQIIEAQQRHPDAEHKINGVEVTQITFVGQVRGISVQATNVTYKVDDGTGTIEVKQWIDSDAGETGAPPSIKEETYVRVYGRIKSFNGRRHVGTHSIRAVTDFNEINMHLLEATYVHLYYTRGPPESLGNSGAAGVKNEGGLFVDQAGYNGASTGQRNLPAMSVMAKRVFNHLQSSPQNNEGLHVQVIAAQLQVPVSEVLKGTDELTGMGTIYTTVDDDTFAVLEY